MGCGTNTHIMKSIKLISTLIVVASTLLSSCVLLEPSPLYHSSFDFYEEEPSYYAETPADDGDYCRVCPCQKYERIANCLNSVCRCGHSRKAHTDEIYNYDEVVYSTYLGHEPAKFAAFVPYESILDAYKEAVELDPNKGNPYAINKNEAYSNILYLPAVGGSYEFEYGDETFYISSVYDSSFPAVNSPFSTRLFKNVHSLSYSGPFYRIYCNRGTHSWRIDVDPLPINEGGARRIYVLMWTSSHSYKFVFRFEQCDFQEP